MKNVADGICASFPRFIHEVGVSFGHLKSAVSEPISYNELALSALGKPGCIGVSEGMKYNFLPPVCDAIIQAKFFHNCGLIAGTWVRIPPPPPSKNINRLHPKLGVTYFLFCDRIATILRKRHRVSLSSPNHIAPRTSQIKTAPRQKVPMRNAVCRSSWCLYLWASGSFWPVQAHNGRNTPDFGRDSRNEKRGISENLCLPVVSYPYQKPMQPGR